MDFDTNNLITTYGSEVRSEHFTRAAELASHRRLLEQIVPILEEEKNRLTEEYEEIRQSSNLDEYDKRYEQQQIEDQEEFLSMKSYILLNSFFINTYTSVENMFKVFCDKHCSESTLRKNPSESNLEFYSRIVKEKIGVDIVEECEDLKKINNSYRHIRNRLVHSQFLAREVDRSVIDSLEGVDIMSWRNRSVIVIDNLDFLVDFIELSKRAMKCLYVTYHNIVYKT